ncbi:MAG: VTT domain-containing protein [Symbiobacterium sp.]|uniref:DedA family protein n=1 Tax=Symbiobacterium sp. TaxID=1971213 RepID=UPI003463C097
MLLDVRIEYLSTLLLAGFMEGTGIPWPGSLIMATIGIRAAHNWHDVGVLTVAFCLGYTLGSLAQYAVGRLLGGAALAWLAPHHRERIEQLIARWGLGAVCWARPLAIGNYVSIPAGMVRMNPLLFCLATFAGAVPWAVATLAAGRLLRSHLGALTDRLERWLLPTVIALAALLLFWWIRILRGTSTIQGFRTVQKGGWAKPGRPR